MSASQQRHSHGHNRRRYLVALFLAFAGRLSQAADEPVLPTTSGCDPAAVIAHVLEQLQTYGPRSEKHEYFGFVYRAEGEIASAVVRGKECRGQDACSVDTTPAAKRIPQGAKVLGEWHTHTHTTGSRMLSIQDVRGARHNVHIRCYSAFYADQDGEMFSWDPRSTSVATAMGSRTTLGRYALDARPPGTPGLASSVPGEMARYGEPFTGSRPE